MSPIDMTDEQLLNELIADSHRWLNEEHNARFDAVKELKTEALRRMGGN